MGRYAKTARNRQYGAVGLRQSCLHKADCLAAENQLYGHNGAGSEAVLSAHEQQDRPLQSNQSRVKIPRYWRQFD